MGLSQWLHSARVRGPLCPALPPLDRSSYKNYCSSARACRVGRIVPPAHPRREATAAPNTPQHPRGIWRAGRGPEARKGPASQLHGCGAPASPGAARPVISGA